MNKELLTINFCNTIKNQDIAKYKHKIKIEENIFDIEIDIKINNVYSGETYFNDGFFINVDFNATIRYYSDGIFLLQGSSDLKESKLCSIKSILLSHRDFTINHVDSVFNSLYRSYRDYLTHNLEELLEIKKIIQFKEKLESTVEKKEITKNKKLKL